MRRVGGSDIPKLLGVSPYGDALDVYRRIVEGVESAWNAPMDRGAAFEPVLRAYGQNHLGIELEETESDYHDHPTHDFARAQIDDLASWQGLPVVVDYKTVNRFKKGWGARYSDTIPEDIRAQVAWEMLCADRDLGLVVAGFGEDAPLPTIFSLTHVVPYQVERDGQFESYCVAVVNEFWERHILPRVPPQSKPLGKKVARR